MVVSEPGRYASLVKTPAWLMTGVGPAKEAFCTMLKPENTPRSRHQSPHQTPQPLEGEPSPDQLRLWTTIDDALQSIRRQRLALRQVKDDGYDEGRVRQQLGRLAKLQGEVQQLLDAAQKQNLEDFADIRAKSVQVRNQLTALVERWESPGEQRPERKGLKKQLHEVMLQLRMILSDLDAELEELDEPSGADDREVIATLMVGVEEETRRIAIADLGQSRKATLLKQLHELTLQVHRLRQLASKSHLKGRIAPLEGVALQIQDAVDGLDVEASNAFELMDSSISVLDRCLCRLEYDRWWIPLPLSWCVNRYRDVTRLKSIQARVLAGLGFSLMLSGFSFVLFTVPLTFVSAYYASSGENLDDNLKGKYTDLAAEIDRLFVKEQEQEAFKIQISGISNQIEDLKALETPVAVEPAPQQGQAADANDDVVPPSQSPPQNAAAAVTDGAAKKDESREASLKLLRNKQAELLSQEREAGLVRLKTKTNIETLLQEVSKLRAETKGDESNKFLNFLASFISDQEVLNHSQRIILAAFAGAIGSIMSILIRLDQMDRENIKNPFLLGALKPLIGSIFGVAVFAILSTKVIDILPAKFYLESQPEGQLAGSAGGDALSSKQSSESQDPLGDLDSQELYKIFLVAFIAGFSERLANDTLKSVSSNRTI